MQPRLIKRKRARAVFGVGAQSSSSGPGHPEEKQKAGGGEVFCASGKGGRQLFYGKGGNKGFYTTRGRKPRVIQGAQKKKGGAKKLRSREKGEYADQGSLGRTEAKRCLSRGHLQSHQGVWNAAVGERTGMTNPDSGEAACRPGGDL